MRFNRQLNRIITLLEENNRLLENLNKKQSATRNKVNKILSKLIALERKKNEKEEKEEDLQILRKDMQRE